MELVKTQNIFFNSSSRSNGEIYDLITILPPDLLKWNDDETGELVFVSFTAKSAYYNIDTDRNNIFYLIEGASTRTVTLTPGNYNVIELASELQTQLNTSCVNYDWVVTYDTKTHKFTFTYTLIGTPQSPLRFTFLIESHDILGFASSGYTITSSPFTSSNLISIGNLEAFYIYCNFINDSKLINASSELSKNNTQILTCIPLVCPFFGTIYYENNNSQYSIKFNDNHTSNTLTITLKDKDNTYFRLQENYLITFKLNIYKKQSALHESMNNLVKLQTINSIK